MSGSPSPPGGDEGEGKKKKKPCRACYDFKTWAKMKKSDAKTTTNASSEENHPQGHNNNLLKECPLDKSALGYFTWSFLHSMAAYYPEAPSPQTQKEMSVFVKLFSKFYPCDWCAKDFRKAIKESPPDTTNRWNLSQWLCRMHNQVNVKLGKEEFDCSLVDKRWRDGWEDGSCD